MRPYYNPSEQMLTAASNARGLSGMNPMTPPGSNMVNSSGPYDKPNMNPQPSNNAMLAGVEQQQNYQSNQFQQAANARGLQTSAEAERANADAQAQSLMTTRVAEALYANDAGANMSTANAVMRSPEGAAFLGHLGNGKALAAGMDPNLMANEINANMLRS